jgi:hypothetical protein
MSMTAFAEVDVTTGRILRIGACPGNDLPLQDTAAGAALVPDPPTALMEAPGDWWFTGVVGGGSFQPKKPLAFDRLVIEADGVDAATLARPGTFKVEIDGEPFEVEDTLVITSDMPATYRVVVSREQAFPYQPLDVEIVALAPGSPGGSSGDGDAAGSGGAAGGGSE